MEEKKLVPKLRFPGFTEPGNSVSLVSCSLNDVKKQLKKMRTYYCLVL